MNFTTKRLSNQCLEVRLKYKAGFQQSFLLQSDIHFDNPKCDRKLYFSHLEQARRRRAGIFTFGDFYCLMQGRYDPRRSKKNVRPEHNTDNYIDVVFEDAATQLKDYAELFTVFSDGNHETSVLKNLEINPLANLVDKLSYKYGARQVHHMPYQGYIRFVFEHAGGGRVQTKTLFFHHGKFGGIISKGVQGVARHAAVVPDADYIITGHTHDMWLVRQPRYLLLGNGEVVVRDQMHIKTGTYKEEFAEGSGWAVQNIVKPKSLGGWWLEFFYEKGEVKERVVMV